MIGAGSFPGEIAMKMENEWKRTYMPRRLKLEYDICILL